MMLFRPVRENDLDDIIRLASRAGVGMTSLPNDPVRPPHGSSAAWKL